MKKIKPPKKVMKPSGKGKNKAIKPMKTGKKC